MTLLYSAQCNETFYVRYLLIFVKKLERLSLAVFSSIVNVCKKGWSLTIKHFQVLHSWVGSWPCLQTLDQAGKACQGQKLQPNTKNVIYGRKRFCNIAPQTNICEQFELIARLNHTKNTRLDSHGLSGISTSVNYYNP